MDRQAIYDAILKADAAGDAEAVKVLGAHLKELDAGNGGVLEVDVQGQSPDIAAEAANRPLDAANPAFSEAMLADERPTSFSQGVLEGVEKPLNNAARALEAGVNYVAPGLADGINNLGRSLGMSGTVAEAEQSQQRYNDAQGVRASGLGKFVGEVAGTLPVAALPGGLLTQGAAGGALLTNSRDAVGIAKDAALGVGGAYVGGAAIKGAANLVAPRLTGISDNLRTLMAAGVRTTPGQVARGTEGGGRVAQFLRERVSNAEDKNISFPFIGEAIRKDRNRSLRDFETATLNRALEPIGQTLPANLSGRRAIKYAGDTLSDEYDRVLPNIRQFAPDQQFVDDLVNIQDTASEMLPERAKQLNSILGGMTRLFGNGGTTLDGVGLKAIETRLGEKIRRLSRSTDADQLDLATALEQARSAVRDAAGRAYPDVAADLSNINRGWAGLVQVERAALNSKGAITPNGYSQAVKMGESTTRRRGYSRGDALNQDLADAGSDILPSQIADSGTAGRAAEANVLGLAFGAAKMLPYALQKGVNAASMRQAGPRSTSLANLMRAGASRAAPVLAPLPSYLTALTSGSGQ